jgi:hypothetical protein
MRSWFAWFLLILSSGFAAAQPVLRLKVPHNARVDARTDFSRERRDCSSKGT